MARCLLLYSFDDRGRQKLANAKCVLRVIRSRRTPLETVSYTPISRRNPFFAFGPTAALPRSRQLDALDKREAEIADIGARFPVTVGL